MAKGMYITIRLDSDPGPLVTEHFLWPRTAEWDIPDFKSIVEGSYHGQKPVKVNGKPV